MSKHLPDWAFELYENEKGIPILDTDLMGDDFTVSYTDYDCMIAQLVAIYLGLTK